MARTSREARLAKLARRLDIWIKQRNLTQREAAERLGISIHSLKKYRYKEHMPRDRELLSMERKSDDGGEAIKVSDLLDDPPAEAEADEYDAIARAVVSQLTGIPKDDLVPGLGLLDAAREAAVEAKKAEIDEKAKRRKAELQPSPESRRPSPAEKHGRGDTR